ncbi:MAG: C4-type zinc ribbon domain-containing protein [Actinomycetota bacterium]|nr:C4-type zinc ribbon domain-containing protein [Actinomycetota bacterium]
MTSPALEALLAVQGVDTDIDRHRHRREALPDKQEATDLDRRIAVLDRDGADVGAVLAEIVAREEVLEADLAATEARIVEVNRRLYGGQVAASRELQAMAADVKSLQGRQSDLEDRVLVVLDEREPHDRRVGALAAERVAAEARRDELAVTIAGAEAGIDAEIAALDDQRATLVPDVPADLLATYERLRSRLGGVGVARLVGSQCQGCFLTLPSGEVDRLRHLPADSVVTCEDCGRILVVG